ncbi:hypothetical protein ILUMI_13615 [Ignelater luminosus]|uniref:Thioester reductase (TE) domain-containing protein n=1 Tax=Ignelater luminosus TaxID=2038154 RepID=A0A8K0D0E4_IGNLU|nr:hypothetical protein ILUMI_13615 [Ignelater luminosus]
MEKLNTDENSRRLHGGNQTGDDQNKKNVRNNRDESSAQNSWKTLLNRERSEDIRRAYEIDNSMRNPPYFIIGTTGFLGRLILEKLIRTCKVREKKGKSAKERYAELFHPILFGELKEEDPNFLDKVILMEGTPEFGIKRTKSANTLKRS